MWGGIFGEDGRYDAFATLLEILRVRLLHPTADPASYRDLDARFKRFSECDLGEWCGLFAAQIMVQFASGQGTDTAINVYVHES